MTSSLGDCMSGASAVNASDATKAFVKAALFLLLLSLFPAFAQNTLTYVVPISVSAGTFEAYGTGGQCLVSVSQFTGGFTIANRQGIFYTSPSLSAGETFLGVSWTVTRFLNFRTFGNLSCASYPSDVSTTFNGTGSVSAPNVNNGFWVGGCSCGSQACTQSDGYTFDCSINGYLTYRVNSPNNSLPQCSDFLPVSAPACKGGTGLWLAGTPAQLMDVIDNAFPGGNDNPARVNWLGSFQQSDTLSRPDGSQCAIGFNSGAGAKYEAIVCPLGFEETCEENPNQSFCQGSSSSAEENSSSSGAQPDLCEEFPNLPGCQPPSSDSRGDGFGGDCLDLHNCDWARIDVQLIQLGVEREIRDRINGIAGLVQAGYNITEEQTGILNGIVNAIGNGSRDIVGAIDGLLDGLGGSGGGVSDGVFDGLSRFFGDSSGLGGLDSLFGDGGVFGDGIGGGQMGDSLGNGGGVRNKMRQAIGIDSSTFMFFGSGGQCPVFDLSFSTQYVSCPSCRIDTCDIFGVNAAAILKAFVWLSALFSVIFMDLQTLKTGGRS